MKTMRVKAAPGRKVPIHPSVARANGGGMLFVEGEEIDLPNVSYVRRRIAAGDLVVAAAPIGGKAALAGYIAGGGPPAVFGDAKPYDPTNPGPHIAAPLAPLKES